MLLSFRDEEVEVKGMGHGLLIDEEKDGPDAAVMAAVSSFRRHGSACHQNDCFTGKVTPRASGIGTNIFARSRSCVRRYLSVLHLNFCTFLA